MRACKNVSCSLAFALIIGNASATKKIRKIILVLMVFVMLAIPSMASNISINANKTLTIDGKETFPVYIYGVCHTSAESTYPCAGNETLTNPGNTSDFTFSILATDANIVDSKLSVWQPLFENAGIYWTTRTSNATNGYVRVNNTQRDSSHFFGYYQIDEPTGSGNETVAKLQDIYNKTKANDSNHPIIVNIGRGTDPWVWNVTGDIMMWDGYSIKNNSAYNIGREDAIMDWDLRAYTQLIKKDGTNHPFHQYAQPWFTTIQANGANTSLTLYPPTDAEERALTYAAISQDIQGIGFYGYIVLDGSSSVGMSDNSSKLTYIKQLARELKGLNDILVLPTIAHSWYGEADWTNVKISPNPSRTFEGYTNNYNFSYILKNDTVNNKQYLIVANKVNISQSNRTITIASLAGTGSKIATTLGLETSGSQAADRTLMVTNGVFNDSFDAYAAHIYEIADNHPRYDVVENGIVDLSDLILIGQHFNEVVSVPYPRYDVNMDGLVDISDITITAQHFGDRIAAG